MSNNIITSRRDRDDGYFRLTENGWVKEMETQITVTVHLINYGELR